MLNRFSAHGFLFYSYILVIDTGVYVNSLCKFFYSCLCSYVLLMYERGILHLH